MVTPDRAPEEVDVMARPWRVSGEGIDDQAIWIDNGDEPPTLVAWMASAELAAQVVARHNEWLEAEAFKAKLWSEEDPGCTCLEVFNQHAATCSKRALLAREEAP